MCGSSSKYEDTDISRTPSVVSKYQCGLTMTFRPQSMLLDGVSILLIRATRLSRAFRSGFSLGLIRYREGGPPNIPVE